MKLTHYIFIVFLLLLNQAPLNAIPEKPDTPKLVNDFANFLPKDKSHQLEQILNDFEKKTSNQIAVVTVKDLEGYAISDYAFRLGEQWGIGKEGKDNGILILIRPKTKDTKGRAFIATGYGLEGAVPDVVAKRIVDQEMIPRFKKGRYYEGILASVKVLFELTKGEYTAEQYIQQKESTNPAPFLILAILVFIVIRNLSRANRYRKRSVGHSVPFMTALFLGSTMGSSRGSWNNFSSGGGGGMGGFGGFGGGGFGGGGAGGSW